MKKLPGQIIVALALNLPAIIFAFLCLYQIQLIRIILPYSLVILANLLIHLDYIYNNKGLTAVLGLIIIPIVQIILLILGFVISLFF
jgi:hypothetical protein